MLPTAHPSALQCVERRARVAAALAPGRPLWRRAGGRRSAPPGAVGRGGSGGVGLLPGVARRKWQWGAMAQGLRFEELKWIASHS